MEPGGGDQQSHRKKNRGKNKKGNKASNPDTGVVQSHPVQGDPLVSEIGGDGDSAGKGRGRGGSGTPKHMERPQQLSFGEFEPSESSSFHQHEAGGRGRGNLEWRGRGMPEGRGRGMPEGRGRGMHEGRGRGMPEGRGRGMPEGRGRGRGRQERRGGGRGSPPEGMQIGGEMHEGGGTYRGSPGVVEITSPLSSGNIVQSSQSPPIEKVASLQQQTGPIGTKENFPSLSPVATSMTSLSIQEGGGRGRGGRGRGQRGKTIQMDSGRGGGSPGVVERPQSSPGQASQPADIGGRGGGPPAVVDRPPQSSPGQASQPVDSRPIQKDATSTSIPPALKEPPLSVKASMANIAIPSRPDLKAGGTLGRKTKVETNHLSLDLSKLKTTVAIHYDVDINPEKPKRLYRKIFEAFRVKNFPNRHPAFDGRKNAYCSNYLPGCGPDEELFDEVEVYDDEKSEQPKYKVVIKFASSVDLRSLSQYMSADFPLDMPQKAIQALDVVLRNAPATSFITVGRSFFKQPEQIIPLGCGMHMWVGFYQSVILGWKPYLNVDVAHKGFPAAGNVIDVMNDVLSSRYSRFEPNKELDNYQKEEFLQYIKGLKVEYQIPNIPSSKRTYKVNSIARAASKLSFTLDGGRELTVQQYFHSVKGYNLKYPNMPCLHVGSLKREKPIFLPSELCSIIPGQVTFKKLKEQPTSQMIRYAATSSDIRKTKIEKSIKQAAYNMHPCVKEFGLSVGETFEEVDARILNPPALMYQREITPRKGVWHADKFFKGKVLNNWEIINNGAYGIREPQMWDFARGLKSAGFNLGMEISDPRRVSTIDRNSPPHALEDLLKSCKERNVDLVIIIIPDESRGKSPYANVKQLAELKVGILTQCLKPRTVTKLDRSTLSNILLKINSKLDGVNHTLKNDNLRPACLRRPVMLIGADVTHPSPDNTRIPSVAAVCASHDPDAFKYNIEFRFQPPRMEIIQDLEQIIRNQLIFFRKKTNCVPERLIFYRDGVSEGQFEQVLQSELNAIRRACSSLNTNYKPAITFLVVQKRHHTRFFPKFPGDEDGKNRNVPAGTIVDTTITHPRHLDFYLVSHASIQGVSRPTKYRKLWDDVPLSVDEIEQLTYYLCHLFSRCTRSVSYPAPTYYAHLAAYRARAYIEGTNLDLNNLDHEQTMRRIKEDFVKQCPMFFV